MIAACGWGCANRSSGPVRVRHDDSITLKKNTKKARRVSKAQGEHWLLVVGPRNTITTRAGAVQHIPIRIIRPPPPHAQLSFSSGEATSLSGSHLRLGRAAGLAGHLYARVGGQVPRRGREHVLGGVFPAIAEFARVRSDVSHDGRDLICSQKKATQQQPFSCRVARQCM